MNFDECGQSNSEMFWFWVSLETQGQLFGAGGGRPGLIKSVQRLKVKQKEPHRTESFRTLSSSANGS